jgi:hypothetical protein
MRRIKHFFKILALRLFAFVAKLYAYYLASNGVHIVNPNDVEVYTSLINKGCIAPNGKVFYIARLKLNGILYHKNVAIYRKNIPASEEKMLIRKCKVIFANGITRRLNK